MEGLNSCPQSGDVRVTDDTRTTCADDDNLLIPGIQFDSVQTFAYRQPSLTQSITVTPIIVDFRTLLQCKTSVDIVKGVSNRDLLHAVVALYNVSLTEMMPDILYSSVCDKWSRTIVLLRDVSETLTELNSRSQRTASNVTTTTSEAHDDNSVTGVSDVSPCKNGMHAGHGDNVDGIEKDDKYEPVDEKLPVFADVFSDDDDETRSADEADDDDDDDDSDNDEEDFSSGIYRFINDVNRRRSCRRRQAGSLSQDDVSIENRLIAATTFEKTYIKPGDRVVHLTLIAVRKRFRKCKIGEYLLSQVKEGSVVGKYDAVVVHADNSAVSFFKKYAFTDDVVLNSRWRELAEQYTQCTLMSYLPPFTIDSGATCGSLAELDIAAMDNEIHRWHQKSIDAYRAEVSCVNRLRHEVVHLRQLVSSQQHIISSLTATCDELRRDKYIVEKEFLDYRLSSSKLALGVGNISSDSDCDDVDVSEQIIAQLKLSTANTKSKKRNQPDMNQSS